MPLDLDAFNTLAEVETAPKETIIQRLRFDDALEIPHQLTDVDLWLNYTNDDLYYLDRAVRGVINKTRWTRMTKGHMKTAVPLVFMQIFGRAPEAADSQTSRMLHQLMRYYCTTYTGTSKIKGQRFSRVYYFSKYACSSKNAKSLRLRLEEADGRPTQFSDYGAGNDKRANPGRGTTPNGPLADDGSGVSH